MTAAAVRILAKSLRYNAEQAKADLARMQPVRTRDQFYHQGYQNGRIAVMEAVAESLEALDDYVATPPGPREESDEDHERAWEQQHRTFVVPATAMWHWQAQCSTCGDVGIPERNEADAQAIADRHQAVAGFERAAADTAERDRATNGGAGYPVG